MVAMLLEFVAAIGAVCPVSEVCVREESGNQAFAVGDDIIRVTQWRRMLNLRRMDQCCNEMDVSQQLRRVVFVHQVLGFEGQKLETLDLSARHTSEAADDCLYGSNIWLADD